MSRRRGNFRRDIKSELEEISKEEMGKERIKHNTSGRRGSVREGEKEQKRGNKENRMEKKIWNER